MSKEPISLGKMAANSATFSSAIDAKFSFERTTPKSIGWWCVTPGVRVAVYKLPNRFHKWTMKLFFGWTFEPYTETTTKQMLNG